MSPLLDFKTLTVIVILAFLLSIAAMGFCPLYIPIHFSGGHADRFVNKYLGLFLFPVLMAVALILHKFEFKTAWGIYFLALLHLYLLYHAVF
ncbi:MULTISPECIES: DUF1648 domain-containing protein [Paenibacillus]|uniref:DUF1648 domain-containing protein n=1 Tax=Paenibacillus albilobatus TaxID=2716884 RepID=A0A919XPE1_9BACL|nr:MULTISPECIES: DUF1648 domain-containing protein [Paenibacillus]GIO34485.1 hypothetical protein J2TS6_56260 [Paenibacillus albilobatus]